MISRTPRSGDLTVSPRGGPLTNGRCCGIIAPFRGHTAFCRSTFPVETWSGAGLTVRSGGGGEACLDRSLKSIARAYLGEASFDALHMFFSEIWANAPGYRYRVFMARRCFDLNEIFLKIASADGELDQYDLTGMMSNYALPLYAGEVARRYAETGRIDSILIVDDIIIHGRTIQRLLYDFEKDVEQALRRLGAGDETLYTELHRKLTDAVTIRVYLANKGRFLVDVDYFWKLSWTSCVDRIKWQETSQRISWLIQDSEVANTSFVVSALGEPEALPQQTPSAWKRFSWTLRERVETFYFSRLNDETAQGGAILLAVRSYLVRDALGNRRRLFIPFVFGGTAYGVTLEKLWANLSVSMEHVSRTWAEARDLPLLKRYVPGTLKVQLVYLIFSAVALRRFFESVYGGVPEDIRYDLEKAGRSFGAAEDTGALLEAVLDGGSAAEYCEKCLRMSFQGFSEDSLGWEGLEQPPDERTRFRLNREMENLLFQIGLRSEREAFQLTEGHRIFYPESGCNDICSFYEFIGDPKFREYPLCFRLASALMLADAGVGSINLKAADTREELVFRAGEQALFCKPRQYAPFISALIMIENLYYPYGEKTVIDQVEKFQAYLRHRLPLDWEAYPSLGELVEDLYSIGQQINMWNINLYFSVELPPDGRKRTRREQLQQAFQMQEDIRAVCREYLATQRY